MISAGTRLLIKIILLKYFALEVWVSIYIYNLLVGSGLILMFEMLLVSSAVIKLTLLIWLKNLSKSESKRYFCNSRIQNNSTIYTSKYSQKLLVGV